MRTGYLALGIWLFGCGAKTELSLHDHGVVDSTASTGDAGGTSGSGAGTIDGSAGVGGTSGSGAGTTDGSAGAGGTTSHSSCEQGWVSCGNECVMLNSDAEHCGACGNACPSGAECVGGICGCQAGFTVCEGECVDTSTDSHHCGGCGVVCPHRCPHCVDNCLAVPSPCSGGTCEARCASGLYECGGSCIDPCNNVEHCGLCDNACGPAQVCYDGGCFSL